MSQFVVQADDAEFVTAGVTARSVINARAEQQDAMVVSPHLLAVADGLGGHVGGAEASRTALAALTAAVTGPCSFAELLAGVDAAQAAVAALADGELRNPGSTLVAVAVADDGSCLHGVWSGDSRVWALTGAARAVPLTFDHVHAGGGLSACLGDHGDPSAVRADTFSVDVGHGFGLVLCSDGVHGRLGGRDEQLRARLVAEIAGEGAASLVERAVRTDTDNATAIVVDVDTWVAAVTPARGPRRWPVRRARVAGECSSWIPGLSEPVPAPSPQAADVALAEALGRRVARAELPVAFSDLAAEVAACDGDIDAVVRLLDRPRGAAGARRRST
jgi:protein phosphatase